MIIQDFPPCLGGLKTEPLDSNAYISSACNSSQHCHTCPKNKPRNSIWFCLIGKCIHSKYLAILYTFVIVVKGLAIVTKYITKGWKEVHELYKEKALSVETEKLLKYLEAVEKVKQTEDELEVIHLIEEHRLVKEHLLTNHLKSNEVSPLENVFILLSG